MKQAGQSIQERLQANSTRIPHPYSGQSILCIDTGKEFSIYDMIDCGVNIKFCFINPLFHLTAFYNSSEFHLSTGACTITIL